MGKQLINEYQNETVNSINKPLTLFGFKPLVFLVVVAIMFVSVVISWKLLIGMSVLVMVLSGVLIRAQKKGNYDYLKQLMQKGLRVGEIYDDGISGIINEDHEGEK